jgi:uncharacterized protein (DUF58 family)
MGVRDYFPSDSIKKIHWKATARASKLQVRLLEPTTTTGAAIFFNIDSYLAEGVTEDAFEHGISTAAGIARYIMEKGNATGLYVNTLSADTKLPIRVPISNATAQMKVILEALAKVTRFSSGAFDDFIDRERKLLTWGTALIVIVDAVRTPMEPSFAHLRNAGYRLSVYETQSGKSFSVSSKQASTRENAGVRT